MKAVIFTFVVEDEAAAQSLVNEVSGSIGKPPKMRLKPTGN